MGMKLSDIYDYDKLDPFKEESIRRLSATLKYPNCNQLQDMVLEK